MAFAFGYHLGHLHFKDPLKISKGSGKEGTGKKGLAFGVNQPGSHFLGHDLEQVISSRSQPLNLLGAG